MKKLFYLLLFIPFITNCQVNESSLHSESWTQEKVKIFDNNQFTHIQQSIKIQCIFKDKSDLSSLISVTLTCINKKDCSSYTLDILDKAPVDIGKKMWRFCTDEEELTIYRDESGVLVIILHQLHGVNIEYKYRAKRT